MDIQLTGYTFRPDDPFLPLPYWRKMADWGVLYCMGMRDLPRSITPQRAAAYAILALLDAQPDDPRQRLFRLWVYTSDWWLRGHLGGSGHDPDRLPADEVPDVVCVMAAAEEHGVSLADVYMALRQLILDNGEDVRPIWRRGTDLPWPRTPDVLTVSDVARRAGVKSSKVREWIAKGYLRATRVAGSRRGSFYLILERDLLDIKFKEMLEENENGKSGRASLRSGERRR